MNTNTEIWKSIHGYEGFYEVSSCGRVRSLSRWTRGPKSRLTPPIILGTFLGNAGHVRVVLCVNLVAVKRQISRLVAAAFLPNPGNLPEVNHKDGNTGNNRLENLEWVTKSYNRWHQRHVINKPGACWRLGDDCLSRKLSAKDVRQIRRLVGSHTRRQLGTMFGVTPCAIADILNGRSWSSTV